MAVLDTTPRTWVAGELVTATMLNAEIRDALTNLQSSWTAFTPTSSTLTLGNGSLIASYHRMGNTVFGRVRLALGSTSSMSAGTLTFSVPVPYASNYDQVPMGPVYMLDSSVGSSSRRIGVVACTGSGVFFVDNDTGGTVTNTVPWTWASGDILTYSFTYEAA